MNAAPVAGQDLISLDETQRIVRDGSMGVLANDYDPDGTEIRVVAVNGASLGVGTEVAGLYGVLTLSGDGAFSYRTTSAAPRGSPVDDVFSYTIADASGTLASGAFVARVSGINQVPQVAEDVVVISEASVVQAATRAEGILANDGDVDLGDALAVVAVDGRARNVGRYMRGDYGQLRIDADGSYVYLADPSTEALDLGEEYVDRFACLVADQWGATSESWLTVRIIGEYDAPDGGPEKRLFGDESRDHLVGGRGADYMKGFGGDDILVGRGGDDRLWGMKGDDRLQGDGGDDVLRGGGGNDRLGGGSGTDLLSGGSGADVLVGGEDDDVLRGGGGRDLLKGKGGYDLLSGGADADVLRGGAGMDRLLGGKGDDFLYGGVGDDELSGDVGRDRLFGGAGDDRLYGGNDTDQLEGGEGDDRLAGGGGRDLLKGTAGDDRLKGGGGDDKLAGGVGDDEVTGGTGDDWLSGGTGADRFVFAAGDGRDVISDFRSGEDHIAFDVLDGGGLKILDVVQAGHDVVITYGEAGDAIILQDTRVTDLGAGDFLF